MHNFTIDFQNLTIWIIPIIILVITILYLSFKKSKLKKANKILLILRLSIFLVLLLLFLKPSFKWINQNEIPARVIVWIDNSSSLKKQDGFDLEKIKSSLIELKSLLSQKGINTVYKIFDSKITPISDLNQLNFKGTSTNISKILEASGKDDKNTKAGILITDGIFNVGENPTGMKISPDFPIYTIGIGDSVNKTDPRVLNINIPENVMIGDTLSIYTDVIPIGFDESIDIVLRNGDKVLSKKTIETSQNNFIRRLKFDIIPNGLGPQKYYIEIDHENDTNPYNNTKMKIVRVLHSAKNIMIFNGNLSFDARILTKMINDQTEYNVKNYSIKNDKWIPEISLSDFNKKWDFVIFMNFPQSNLSSRKILEIKQRLNNNIPVLLFIDGKTDVNIVNDIFDFNIISNVVINKKVEVVMVHPNKENGIHPIIRDIRYENEDWEELPPLMYPFKTIQINPSFATLISTMELKSRPVVTMFDKQERSIGLCLGTDFWRWKFMPEKNRIYDELFGNIIKWFSDTLNTSNMNMTLDKEIYLTGENAKISGLVYNVKGEVLPLAKVQADVVDSLGNKFVFDLNWNGQEYSSEFTFDKSGEYRINIKSEFEGNIIDSISLSALVMNQSLEQSLVSQDSELLKYISSVTNGEKIEFDDLTRISEQIGNEKKFDEINKELKIWRWIVLFYILLFLFISEWIVRRFQGYQ